MESNYIPIQTFFHNHKPVTLLISHMEKDRSQKAKEILSLIDTLYDEKTRHQGLIGNCVI